MRNEYDVPILFGLGRMHAMDTSCFLLNDQLLIHLSRNFMSLILIYEDIILHTIVFSEQCLAI